MSELNVQGTNVSIKGILFDKDGTLLDFVSMWGSWSKHMLSAFSQRITNMQLTPPSHHELYSLWGIMVDHEEQVIDYDRNGPLAMGTIDELLALLAGQGYSAGISWAEAKKLVYECKEIADKELERLRPVQPLPGVRSFLEQCRKQGLLLAVVTADETDAAIHHLEWLNIREYFSEVIGTDQVERGKPFPDMVELACRRLSLDVSQVAVIGDTNGDMMMARAAGVKLGIGLTAINLKGNESLLLDADVRITSYGQLRLRGAADESGE
ncbi:HAD family hydrolase [Cohnella sp.]|uniref:HAD family hydrolase n=1 Tax=Cohnella sp. TaxID=1883426 RepID=UPI003561DB00